MGVAKVDTRNFLFGIVTLMLVVLGSSFLVTTTAAAAAKEDEEEIITTTTTCENPQYHPNDETLLLYHFESTSSTQDEAKKIVLADDCSTAKAFCVTATEQTNGRGTSGRLWMGVRGNTFVTIGIPQKAWMGLKNVPLSLLPLRIGSLVANRVQGLLDKCGDDDDKADPQPPMVAVKWPNDVLVDEKKISGVLIESSANGDWFLIGIGVNLAYAPPVPTSGPNNGRQSTCIQDICPPSSDLDLQDAACRLGVDLAHDVNQWLQKWWIRQGQRNLSWKNGNNG
jgi:biotin-(acetyl-CoA carboxylase) ligase